MAVAREYPRAVYRRRLIVVARQRAERRDVYERAHARAHPHAREDAARHRPCGILQPRMTRDSEHREELVQHPVLRGVEHELPEKRHHKRAREVRKEVDRAEEHLALRYLAQHQRKQHRRHEPERKRYAYVLERAQPRLPESRVGRHAYEVVESSPLRAADNSVVLERHESSLHKRIVAPQRDRKNGRKEEQPRTPVDPRWHGGRPATAASAFFRTRAHRERDAHYRTHQDDSENRPRDRTRPLDARLVGVEHEPAVRVLRYGLQRRAVVESPGELGEHYPKKTTSDDIARRLPESSVRLRDRLYLPRLKVGVHLPDSGGHVIEMLLEAETHKVRRHAPARAAFGDVAPHCLVVDFRRHKLVDARPHYVALFLRTARDSFRHRIEVLVRLKYGHACFVRRGKRHEPDHVSREVELLRELLHEILAAEYRHNLTAREKLRRLVRRRELRHRPHNSVRDETVEEIRCTQSGRRIEARLPFLLPVLSGFLPDYVTARRLHPRKKSPRTVLYRKRALPALYLRAGNHLVAKRKAVAPLRKLLPRRWSLLGVEPSGGNEVLAVDDSVVLASCDRHAVYETVARRNFLPQRRDVFPARPFVGLARLDPFV